MQKMMSNFIDVEIKRPPFNVRISVAHFVQFPEKRITVHFFNDEDIIHSLDQIAYGWLYK